MREGSQGSPARVATTIVTGAIMLAGRNDRRQLNLGS